MSMLSQTRMTSGWEDIVGYRLSCNKIKRLALEHVSHAYGKYFGYHTLGFPRLGGVCVADCRIATR